METVPYGGWPRCARLVSDGLEALVTLDVGPRVIRFGRRGGPNELVEYPHHAGLTGGNEYRSYGGHRLWVAPEDPAVTYEPDNAPVNAAEEDDWLTVEKPIGPTQMGRSIRLRFEAEVLVLVHQLTNLSDRTVVCAPWCLTVMAPGGVCVFPLPPFKPHSEALLPAAPLVLWHYTDLTDARWSWGRRLVRLRQTEGAGPLKAGAWLSQGWAAYLNHGNAFVKTFDPGEPSSLPDFGCNFETFTRHDMLEVESLGRLGSLDPGESVTHSERWTLVSARDAPDDDDGLSAWLETVAFATRGRSPGST
jgi:hypothetical protein